MAHLRPPPGTSSLHLPSSHNYIEGKEKRARMESKPVKFSPALQSELTRLSESLQQSLSNAPPQSSTRHALQTLIPTNISPQTLIHAQIRDFALCCAALASSQLQNPDTLLAWIPQHLSLAGISALQQLQRACDFDLEGNESLAVRLMPQVLPLLKGVIKESSIDAKEDGDEISAASARSPVAYAVVAAYQFRWFVTQVDYPCLGKLCSWVIPCALTTVDHWSPAVKGQGMISFIHIAKNVNVADLGCYEDVLLDLCCQNIACDDMLWHHVVQMSVLLLTFFQRQNPRSSWFEKMMNEMLSHLERQPRNKERYTTWLELIDPVFDAMGLVLLAHFRRIFPLLFQWMHDDDDKTILLVLQRTHTIIRLTWIRNTPHIERLVDELIITFKEAAMRKAREEIRKDVLQILILLQKCKGSQFEAKWNKYRDDPNLSAITPSLCGESMTMVSE